MAITKLRKIKEAKGNNPAVHLKKNIFYICDPKKTGGGIYIGGNAGIAPETIYGTMINNKEYWCKQDKIQGYHYILSFPPDCGIDEDLAYKIAGEFCEELLRDDFYYVFAVHHDKKHLHVHITFDSVSRTDGLKFHSPKGDWEKRIQPITDRLCKKYHLPVLEYEGKERTGVHYGTWKEGKESYYSWNDIIRDDIDEAILHSDSLEAFLQYLTDQKYQIRNGKYLSLTPFGRQRAIRTGRLGSGYTKEEIIQRIQDKRMEPAIMERYKTYGDREEIRQILFAKVQRTPGWKMTPIQKQFYQRWHHTYFIRRPGRYREAWRYKKNILEVQNLADALNYLISYDIQDEAALHNRKKNVQDEADVLKRQLQVLQNRLRRKNSNKEEIRSEIAEMRKVLNDNKKELLLIDKTQQLLFDSPEYEYPDLQQEESRKHLSEERRKEQDGKEQIDENHLGEGYRESGRII